MGCRGVVRQRHSALDSSDGTSERVWWTLVAKPGKSRGGSSALRVASRFSAGFNVRCGRERARSSFLTPVPLLFVVFCAFFHPSRVVQFGTKHRHADLHCPSLPPRQPRLTAIRTGASLATATATSFLPPPRPPSARPGCWFLRPELAFVPAVLLLVDEDPVTGVPVV